MPYALSELAKLINANIVGNPNTLIDSLSPLENIVQNSLVMVKDNSKLSLVESSTAAAVLCDQHFPETDLPLLQVENPSLALVKLLTHFHPPKAQKPGIDNSAIIASTATISPKASISALVVIGENTKIGDHSVLHPGCKVGENVIIGSNCTLHPNVVIYDNSVLADNIIVHAQTVIGSDGFGYEFDGKQHVKLPHVGNVKIGSNVEIGANTAIDRATLGTTCIGAGSKIDNLVQIAHNVSIGRDTIVCAFTGIAGSSTLGDNVICAAAVGISDHVVVEDGAILGPRTGIAAKKRIPARTTWLGFPARPYRKTVEIIGLQAQLPSIKTKLKKIQQRLNKIESERC